MGRRFQRAREFLKRGRGAIEARDLVALAGCALLWYGLERLLPGAGPAAVGAYLMAIATLGR